MTEMCNETVRRRTEVARKALLLSRYSSRKAHAAGWLDGIEGRDPAPDEAAVANAVLLHEYERGYMEGVDSASLLRGPLTFEEQVATRLLASVRAAEAQKAASAESQIASPGDAAPEPSNRVLRLIDAAGEVVTAAPATLLEQAFGMPFTSAEAEALRLYAVSCRSASPEELPWPCTCGRDEKCSRCAAPLAVETTGPLAAPPEPPKPYLPPTVRQRVAVMQKAVDSLHPVSRVRSRALGWLHGFEGLSPQSDFNRDYEEGWLEGVENATHLAASEEPSR